MRLTGNVLAAFLLAVGAPPTSAQEREKAPATEAEPVAPVIAPPVIVTPPAVPPSGVRLSRRKEYAVTPSADGKTLHIAGKIMSGITTAFKDAVRKNPSARTVVLSSNGGILVEGLGLANIIRKNGLNTHAEFVCASACTFVFLAGKERSIAPTAAIGFHQSSKPTITITPGGDNQQYVSGNEAMRAVYAEAGLDAPFIEAVLKTPPTDMWFPDHAEVLGKRIATRASDAQEFAVAAGPWKSSNEFVTTLGGDPLFKAAQSLKPRYFRVALSEAWTAAAVGSSSGDTKAEALALARMTLVRQLVADVDRYDDALLERFIVIEKEAWGAKDSALNTKCEASIGAGFPVDAASTGDLLSRQDAVLMEMIRKPVERSEPTQQRLNEAETVMLDFWGRMISEYSYDGLSIGNSFCREPGNHYDVLATLPVGKRVATFRSLVLTALRQGNLPRLPFF